MSTRAFGRSWSALLLLATGGCAPSAPAGISPPAEGPLPSGMYDLTANVSYRDDTDLSRHYAHVSYASTLYVTYDGTTELYDGDQRCTDWAHLPDETKRRLPPPRSSYYFQCGDRDWNLWVEDHRIVGRVYATVTETVQSRMKCTRWSFDTGHQICEEWGIQLDPRTTVVAGVVQARKVSEQ